MADLNTFIILVLAFAIMSIVIFINHEISIESKSSLPQWLKSFHANKMTSMLSKLSATKPPTDDNIVDTRNTQKKTDSSSPPHISQSNDDQHLFQANEKEKRGKLICDGKEVDSEIIYWKKVKGDRHFESPITPHHGTHHDRYLTFEYDNGGWNNIRMGLECLLVIAHAMGRTIVIPPQQHLYLLGQSHQDKEDKKAHSQMGFEDFFDLELLQSHQGFHMITMKEFLTEEASTGGLNPQKMPLPNNDTNLWGRDLWYYLTKVADATPAWGGKYVVFPANIHEMNHTNIESFQDHSVRDRIHQFGGERSPVFYDEQLQNAHHIHFRGDDHYRVLQHHYAFTFFADKKMQSFYKRFIRDYMRYKDNIQCTGHTLVQAVRADSLKYNPNGGGVYYALHIRRGDFQFKEVKLSAADIIKNLNFTDHHGNLLIPPNSLVYVSTDDPDGLCTGCMVQRKDCREYTIPKPPGCPDDPSWDAFHKNGWKVRYLRDYEKQGLLHGVNPNTYGMLETIVCSRAKVFAGTYFSTFTGFIHRLRGYHGLGEDTYYHSTGHIHALQIKKSVGHGFSREWRAGWTDDEGNLI